MQVTAYHSRADTDLAVLSVRSTQFGTQCQAMRSSAQPTRPIEILRVDSGRRWPAPLARYECIAAISAFDTYASSILAVVDSAHHPFARLCGRLKLPRIGGVSTQNPRSVIEALRRRGVTVTTDQRALDICESANRTAIRASTPATSVLGPPGRCLVIHRSWAALRVAKAAARPVPTTPCSIPSTVYEKRSRTPRREAQGVDWCADHYQAVVEVAQWSGEWGDASRPGGLHRFHPRYYPRFQLLLGDTIMH